jgi:hypothetical protein
MTALDASAAKVQIKIELTKQNSQFYQIELKNHKQTISLLYFITYGAIWLHFAV